MTDDNEPHAHPQPSAGSPRAQRYRRAFLATLALAVTFGLATAMLWWQLQQRSMPRAQVAAPASADGDLGPRVGSPAEASAPPGGGAEGLAKLQEIPLAPIQLSPQRLQSISLQTGSVAYKPVEDELRVVGKVQVDERRLASVQTRFAGWIRHLYVATTGEFVRRGQTLFTVYSPDLVTTEQDYLLARKNQSVLALSSVDGVAAAASSLLNAAKARLQQWQVSVRDIEKLEASGQVMTDLPFDSPVSGYVLERNALANMYVQPETKLYTVADLGRVWVYAQVFESDAGKVKPGDFAEVTVDAYPGTFFKGRVDYLLPQLDTSTRTLPIRMEFPNPELKLRPGMYVNVRLRLPLGLQLVVPATSVFQSGTGSLVFLYHGDGNIEPRQVEVGSRVSEGLVVTTGLAAGDVIVTSANFLIDSEAQLQAAAGAFMPLPPGAVAAAAINRKAPEVAVEMTTDPSPPRKGSNGIRVRVVDPDGKAVVGAAVNVTFFMAAMPAMGMSAMNTTIKATDHGSGLYVGKGDLGSGGTWQVTVTVHQQGRTLAIKHLTVNATGGM